MPVESVPVEGVPVESVPVESVPVESVPDSPGASDQRLHEVSAVDLWDLQTSVVGIRRRLRQLKVCVAPAAPGRLPCPVPACLPWLPLAWLGLLVCASFANLGFSPGRLWCLISIGFHWD